MATWGKYIDYNLKIDSPGKFQPKLAHNYLRRNEMSFSKDKYWWNSKQYIDKYFLKETTGPISTNFGTHLSEGDWRLFKLRVMSLSKEKKF